MYADNRLSKKCFLFMNKCIELQPDSKLGSDVLNTNLMNFVHKALRKYKTSHEKISIQLFDCNDDTLEEL